MKTDFSISRKKPKQVFYSGVFFAENPDRSTIKKERIWDWLENIGIAVFSWFFSTVALFILAVTYDSEIWWFALFFFPFLAAYFATRGAVWNRNRIREIKRQKLERDRDEYLQKLERDRRDRDELQQQLEWDRDELNKGIIKHRHVLLRNYRKAIKKNDYGVVVSDTRKYAISEFLKSIAFNPLQMSKEEAIDYVCRELESPSVTRENEFDLSGIPQDWRDFEHWVAEALRAFGWEADATSGSGDQGIDVIAKKNGISVGIQCKLYSQPVGNKAVQEAIAGARYYGLGISAVLTNGSFTKSATELAQAAQVILLSPYDIPRLEDLCASYDND